MMENEFPSSQSRASRNARQCQSVFRCTPHRQPKTRRVESLRYTPLPIYVGPAEGSPCLQFRLRRFPPSLPSPSVSSSLPAPTCSAYTSGSDCPPPARLTRANDRATLHYSQDSARAGKSIISRSSFCASGSCRGLRPCPLCHLCPATDTANAVAASGPKQHRPSDERPLQRRFEHQRHHPPEGRFKVYIYLFFGRSRADARPLSYVIH